MFGRPKMARFWAWPIWNLTPPTTKTTGWWFWPKKKWSISTTHPTCSGKQRGITFVIISKYSEPPTKSRMFTRPVARSKRLGSVVPWPRTSSPAAPASNPSHFAKAFPSVHMGVPQQLVGLFTGKSHQNGWWLGVPLFQETSIFEKASEMLQCNHMWNIPSSEWLLNLPYSFKHWVCTGRESNIGKLGLHGHQSTCNRNSHLQGVETWCDSPQWVSHWIFSFSVALKNGGLHWYSILCLLLFDGVQPYWTIWRFPETGVPLDHPF